MSEDKIGNFFDPEDFEKDKEEENGETWKPENVYGKELKMTSLNLHND